MFLKNVSASESANIWYFLAIHAGGYGTVATISLFLLMALSKPTKGGP